MILEVYFSFKNAIIHSCVSGDFAKVGFVQ